MEQLKFIDKFVKLFGFKNIADYDTKITVSQFKNTKKNTMTFLNNINKQMDNIKKHFKTGPLSLARKKYVIDTPELAMSVLKKCLQQANIGFEIKKTKKANFVRLIPTNKLLSKYIINMDNICQHVENIDHIVQINSDNEELFTSYKDCVNNIANNLSTITTYPKCHDTTMAIAAMTATNKSIVFTRTIIKSFNDIVFKKLDDERVIGELNFTRDVDFIYDMKLQMINGMGKTLDIKLESECFYDGEYCYKNSKNIEEAYPIVAMPMNPSSYSFILNKKELKKELNNVLVSEHKLIFTMMCIITMPKNRIYAVTKRYDKSFPFSYLTIDNIYIFNSKQVYYTKKTKFYFPYESKHKIENINISVCDIESGQERNTQLFECVLRINGYHIHKNVPNEDDCIKINLSIPSKHLSYCACDLELISGSINKSEFFKINYDLVNDDSNVKKNNFVFITKYRNNTFVAHDGDILFDKNIDAIKKNYKNRITIATRKANKKKSINNVLNATTTSNLPTFSEKEKEELKKILL